MDVSAKQIWFVHKKFAGDGVSLEELKQKGKTKISFSCEGDKGFCYEYRACDIPFSDDFEIYVYSEV